MLCFPLLTFGVKGQVNRMLNYSLEDDTCNIQIGMCPTQNPRWTVPHWYDPSGGYINWFSTCFGASQEGVPQNDLGYQYARTGQCYGGISTAPGSSEGYITGTLSDSLKATKKYCVTFYVNLSDSSWWAISSIGAYFSNDSICAGNNYNILPYTPQIENPNSDTLINKVDWVPVSGEFQANGGEIFITIGTFYNLSSGDFDSVGHGGFVSGENSEVQTYYYVDDVYVRELTIANAGNTDTICAGDSVVIGQNITTPGVSFHWLPAAGLSNPHIAQPKASPITTTIYTLTVINDSVLAVNNRGQACNCADSVTKDSVKIDVCTGINEITNKSFSKIYPDPNTGVFILSVSSIPNESEIVVYNLLGRVIFTSKINSTATQIDLTNQAQGMYFYKILSSNFGLIGSGKFVIN